MQQRKQIMEKQIMLNNKKIPQECSKEEKKAAVIRDTDTEGCING